MKWFPTACLAVLLLLPSTPASAQTTVSAMGGLNMASLDLDVDDALAPILQSVNRMSVGLTSTFPVSDRFGIQLGGTYSQKGGSVDVLGMLSLMADMAMMPGMEGMDLKSELEGMDLKSEIEMDYIELTVLAEVRLPLSGERVSAHLLGGPALALRSSCQMAFSVSRGTFSLDGSEACDEIDLDSKAFDIGLAGGGGIEIGLTDKLNARLGLLYTLGLLDISEDDSGTLKHRALTLRAGLGYPVG
jgi:opacity protein-like surface antigen